MLVIVGCSVGTNEGDGEGAGDSVGVLVGNSSSVSKTGVCGCCSSRSWTFGWRKLGRKPTLKLSTLVVKIVMSHSRMTRRRLMFMLLVEKGC